LRARSKEMAMAIAAKRRAAGVVQVNFSLDKEAYELLREEAPTTRTYGMFLSRLLHEHRARREERARLQQAGPVGAAVGAVAAPGSDGEG
jgi:hypothetical protein